MVPASFWPCNAYLTSTLVVHAAFTWNHTDRSEWFHGSVQSQDNRVVKMVGMAVLVLEMFFPVPVLFFSFSDILHVTSHRNSWIMEQSYRFMEWPPTAVLHGRRSKYHNTHEHRLLLLWRMLQAGVWIRAIENSKRFVVAVEQNTAPWLLKFIRKLTPNLKVN